MEVCATWKNDLAEFGVPPLRKHSCDLSNVSPFQCLRYYGYYVERLFGGDVSYQDYGYRVRQVELVYHMEDDTITVFEPYLENSGLPQGLTCPRRPYYWPDFDFTRKKAYFWTDLHLGCDYQIAHFKIHLYDADDFTKVHLQTFREY